MISSWHCGEGGKARAHGGSQFRFCNFAEHAVMAADGQHTAGQQSVCATGCVIAGSQQWYRVVQVCAGERCSLTSNLH
jgi:hypothetical protein